MNSGGIIRKCTGIRLSYCSTSRLAPRRSCSELNAFTFPECRRTRRLNSPIKHLYQGFMSDPLRNSIIIRGAAEHNLRNIDLELPRDALVVMTGLSGSGKSSLAFDTLYAEGQRRYMESLSAYARQYLDQMHKPKVESIEGLSPAISIEQKTVSRNPRSTVGTSTEIYDYSVGFLRPPV